MRRDNKHAVLGLPGDVIRPSLNRYHGVHQARQESFPLLTGLSGTSRLKTETGAWLLAWEGTEAIDGGLDLALTFTLTDGQERAVAVAFNVDFHEWSKRNYVLLPGAVYNGNRFRSLFVPYPPMFEDPDDQRVDLPVTITRVPRLSDTSGPSRIQQSTGDPATPAVGCFLRKQKQGFWMLTQQQTRFGNSGLYVEENCDRSAATFTVAAPCVREKLYSYSRSRPSGDAAADWSAGDAVTLRVRLYCFDCPDVQGLFDKFFDIRKALTGGVSFLPVLPLHAAAKLIEEHYNRDNWREDMQYYTVSTGRGPAEFQLGWVGGCMQTVNFLVDGDDLSRERARKTLHTVLTRGQAASGLFHGSCGPDGWTSDGFGQSPHPHNAVLIRKNADGLYFFMKQFILLKQQGAEVPRTWQAAVKRLADAFVALWKRYGQFGQFVDVTNGKIVVGGSTSAAMAPGGLALAAQWFDKPKYLAVAESAAEFYYRRDVQAGVTTGGPGEILQGPDSESADAMLESFVSLWETTGKRHWLACAEQMARQAATWTVSYDYRFPPESTFGRLGMRTAGSVIANVQNKHSAPGMCTLSGDSLFKLFRATGERKYLDLIRETTHNITQYVSRQDRPISGMPSGWICERVNMSDWEKGMIEVGEIFHGSCWPEVSLLLASVELPGLYVQPDTGLVCVLDNVLAENVRVAKGQVALTLVNPTAFPARVRVLCETSAVAKTRPLGQLGLAGCPRVTLAPGESRALTLPAPAAATP